MNYFIKTPKLLHSIYRDAVWFLPNSNNEIYLTFDDGPVKGITDVSLDILKSYGIKATYFCVGENAIKNPEIIKRIKEEGHAIGNHSLNHLNGWKTSNSNYIENIQLANKELNSHLFRPPYGKIKRSQLKELNKHYKVIMWDVLSADFDPKVSPEQCVKNVIDHTTSGSIIVIHDNEKCGNKMLTSLPDIIENLQKKGFNFGIIK